MLDFESDKTEEKISIGSLTGTEVWSFTDNWLMNGVITIFARMARFAALKWMIMVLLLGTMAVFSGHSNKNAKIAEEVAGHIANDDISGGLKKFLMETDSDKKSLSNLKAMLNIHPIFKSRQILEWENETDLDFKRTYEYITIKIDGKNQDLFVMKKPAVQIGSEDPEMLERSTTFSTSAKNVCEEYLGEVPQDFQKKFYDSKIHQTISFIKDELTYENDDGAKFFRCVISEELSKELMDE